jgi:hypothetical protein
LWAYPAEEAGCTLLQYVDDLLLAAAYCWDCLKGTELLLCLLWEAGYKVSLKKRLKFARTKLKTWDSTSLKASRASGAKQKQAVCSIPILTTRRHIHEFSEAAGFCWIWIPNFSFLAKPLYKATKGAPNLGV